MRLCFNSTFGLGIAIVKFVFGGTDIAVTHPDASSVLAEVAQRLRAGNGFALATINLDHLVKLGAHAGFRAAYALHDIVVADGNPIVWLSRLARRPVSLTTGSDLILPLVRVAANERRPVVLFGSSLAALEGAARALRLAVPDVIIAHTIAPEQGFDPKGEAAKSALRQMAKDGPCLCLVALGAPKQEEFAALGRELAPQVGFASVGAGVDFLSGQQIRAPMWARRLALEWLWRAMQSPKRMVPRYLNCAAILPGQGWRAWQLRKAGPDAAIYTRSETRDCAATVPTNSPRHPVPRAAFQEQKNTPRQTQDVV
jgi:N-acetylglucosaminyldiphosphoundecaprenol N-acetyl-beta-D-mannosaminyltransferase